MWNPNNPPKPLALAKPTGKLYGGGIKWSYNDPFPCVNGTLNGTGPMQGVIMHTMVCNLPECIKLFNTSGFNASANFGIAQNGDVHQFGPIGQGWMAWHAFPAANPIWYGIEHADNGKPDNPLTDAQLTSSALVFEFLSGFAGFPLQVATRITGRGYAAHYMGGAAWGGHSCPDQPPAHVRSNQRDEIVLRAHKIRNPPAGVTRYEITGTLTVNGHLVDASGVMQVGGVA